MHVRGLVLFTLLLPVFPDALLPGRLGSGRPPRGGRHAVSLHTAHGGGPHSRATHGRPRSVRHGGLVSWRPSRPRRATVALNGASDSEEDQSPPKATTPVLTSSLLKLVEQYDALLLDQFGVIHDGKVAYAGAVDAVRAVQRMGKKIVIISNSSRRRGDTVARLLSMGFGPVEGENGELLHPPASEGVDSAEALVPISVVTSGDLVFEGLSASDAPPYADLGPRCFVFGNGAEDEQYVRECGKVASPINQADFVLARGLFSMLGAGPDLLRQPAAPYTLEAEAQILSQALARGLPLLVANPDEVRPDGADSPMPGQLARRYRAMGAADIRLVGKPHALIYEACRRELRRAGLAPESARVAAVGDSLHHDVLGASQNGFDSIFICGGVHYQELQVPQAQAVPPSPERLNALLAKFAEETGGVLPTHTLAGFSLHP